jgi:hypothetical protein
MMHDHTMPASMHHRGRNRDSPHRAHKAAEIRFDRRVITARPSGHAIQALQHDFHQPEHQMSTQSARMRLAWECGWTRRQSEYRVHDHLPRSGSAEACGIGFGRFAVTTKASSLQPTPIVRHATVIVALIVIVAAGGAALAAHSFTRRAGHDVMAAFDG